MFPKRLPVGIVLLLLIFVSCGKQEKELTYPEIVNRLTDLEALAKLPEKGEQSAMWSSYDRQSKVDSATGEFINWEANDDGLNPQYIRKEGDNEVLAEMEGPGAIVRIWSASPRDGKVKIFIDSEEKPVLDLSFIDYFKPSVAAFEFPELVYKTNARGFNNYIPITYQKSCKIVAEPGWGQYYHFNYITFPENTKVPKFNPQLDESGSNALAKVNEFFAEKIGKHPGNLSDEKSSIQETIESGEVKQVLRLENTGAITSLKAFIAEKDSAKIAKILRKIIFSNQVG